jgi:hypothetical protein
MTFYEFINYSKDKVCKFKMLNNLREMAHGEKFCLILICAQKVNFHSWCVLRTKNGA